VDKTQRASVLNESERSTHRVGKTLLVLGIVGILAIDFVARGQMQIVLAVASLAVMLIGVKVGIR
jgi:hypothetical protein